MRKGVPAILAFLRSSNRSVPSALLRRHNHLLMHLICASVDKNCLERKASVCLHPAECLLAKRCNRLVTRRVRRGCSVGASEMKEAETLVDKFHFLQVPAAAPPLPSRTNWTRLVPPPVLTGRVSSPLPC